MNYFFFYKMQISHREIYTKTFWVGYQHNFLIILLHAFSWVQSSYKWQQLDNHTLRITLTSVDKIPCPIKFLVTHVPHIYAFIWVCGIILNAVCRHFLELGYAVIYLHRQGSQQPFTRQFPQDALLDSLEFKDSADGSTCMEGKFLPTVHSLGHLHFWFIWFLLPAAILRRFAEFSGNICNRRFSFAVLTQDIFTVVRYLPQ